MTRVYTFYENGHKQITTEVCVLGAVRALAVRLFGPRTHYIDVLDEGVLVARIERVS